MEGVGDGVIQPDIIVERDICKPVWRREAAKHGQVEESDGDGCRCKWAGVASLLSEGR